MRLEVDDFYTVPYCVYAHFVDDHLIYIGAGDLCRAFNTSSRKRHHHQMLESGKTKVVIISRHADKNEALEHEKNLIKAFQPPANINYVRPRDTRDTRDRRPIKCVETGVCYFGSAHASEAMRLPQFDISLNVNGRGKPVRGHTFVRVEWSESGLDPADRLKNRPGKARDALTGRAKEILDIIVECIQGGKPSPTNEYIALAAQCGQANVVRAINALCERGYLVCTHPKHGRRIFFIGEKQQVPSYNKTAEKRRSVRKEVRAVLDILTDAAINHRPCPSNADIASITGKQPKSVSELISSMAKQGMLRVELHKDGRIIHIADHSTAPTANHNIAGIATMTRMTRAVDRIIV